MEISVQDQNGKENIRKIVLLWMKQTYCGKKKEVEGKMYARTYLPSFRKSIGCDDRCFHP